MQTLKPVQLGGVVLPGSKDTREIIEVFGAAPAEMLAVTVYAFRRFYFLAQHQNLLRDHAELYAQALRDLGAEVRFATIEEVQAFSA